MYNTGIFCQILLAGMGFEHWKVGFRKKKMGWEMGLVSPFQDPPKTVIIIGFQFLTKGGD